METMAQVPDGSGKSPVVITKDTTSVTSGVDVTQKLVGAAIAFGNVLRGTFGPNGLDKMLYKTNGETAVCLLYTSPSPRDQRGSRMPSSA